METDYVEDFELPGGGLYTGECVNLNGFIELRGEGEINYPTGDRFIGTFDRSSDVIYGKYLFLDGDIHTGWFYNGIPLGIGYLNKKSESTVCMGNFTNGLLNGWAVRIKKGQPQFGWWEKGTLTNDQTYNVEWVFDKIRSYDSDGNGAFNYNNGMFGLGIRIKNVIDTYFYFGFLFYKNGSVSVGLNSNYKKDGLCAFFKSDGSIEYAKYHDDMLVKKYTPQIFFDEVENFSLG